MHISLNRLGVCLLAFNCMAGAGLAADAPAAESPPSPDICLSDNRTPDEMAPAERQLIADVQDRIKWSGLDGQLKANDVELSDDVCRGSKDPMINFSILDVGKKYRLSLNTAQMRRNGPVISVQPLSSQFLHDNRKDFSQNIIHTLADEGVTGDDYRKQTDDQASLAILMLIKDANVDAEAILQIMKDYTETGDPEELKKALNTNSYTPQITNLWQQAADHNAAGSDLTMDEKNAFRRSIIDWVLADDNCRVYALKIIESGAKMIEQESGPGTTGTHLLSPDELNARIKRYGEVVAKLDVAGLQKTFRNLHTVQAEPRAPAP